MTGCATVLPVCGLAHRLTRCGLCGLGGLLAFDFNGLSFVRFVYVLGDRE